MQRPNLVLILVDNMGYGDIGDLSHGSPRTPSLNTLVAESVCLTQHYSASAV